MLCKKCSLSLLFRSFYDKELSENTSLRDTDWVLCRCLFCPLSPR